MAVTGEGKKIPVRFKPADRHFLLNCLGPDQARFGGLGPAVVEHSGGIPAENMFNSIKPGMYLPGGGGIPHSDIVQAVHGGYELLARHPLYPRCRVSAALTYRLRAPP